MESYRDVVKGGILKPVIVQMGRNFQVVESEKYNITNRGGALAVEQPEFMKARFRDLNKGNRYVTTIHVINSAFIKLSKITKAETVYRGVAGGLCFAI